MKVEKKTLQLVVVALGLVLFGAVAALGFNVPGFSKYEKVGAVKGEVAVEVSKVSDGKAHFYSYAEGGKEYKFFVVKGRDGVLHTAFDACDVCYREKKGYVQEGDAMHCKNCGKNFAIARIGADSSGGCNPSHLPARNDGKRLTVKVADLKSGARFF